ncbi:MAG: radical SAM protein [Dehalococcoidia bacterium]|nr:radical SAM protein [Dehalococcoidia bacterium]
MANVSPLQAMKLIGRGIHNYVTKRPLVVGYEVTLSCNLNCRHCDLGKFVKDEKQIKPDEYGNLTRRLSPVVAIFSGGEPLLRKDIVAIVKAVKQSDGTPYLILVSNGVLLNESNYLQLHEVGVNQFSVSLDFPDERQDEFRGRSGLYKHLEQTLPRLAKFGFRDVLLNTAITKANLREILPLARKAVEWGVDISYSAYTALRTGNKDYCVKNGEDLGILRQTINELATLRRRDNHIANPEAILVNTLKFLEQGYLPDCRAGIRSLVVMPDGSLVPCSMHRSKYATQKEMVEKFSRANQCSSCYCGLRSYSELSLLNHMKSIPQYIKRLFARNIR